MQITLILILFSIIICTIYLLNFKIKFYKSFLLFSLIFFSTLTIYLTKGDLRSFTYDKELEMKIKKLLESPDEIRNLDPNLMIIYLEKKLKKNPDDISGWLILARTCMLSGYIQKAEKHYQSILKFFPNNENALLEYSILKKNTNQTQSALKILFQLKKFFPENMKGRDLIIQILKENKNTKKANEEIKELLELKKNDKESLKKIIEKYNL